MPEHIQSDNGLVLAIHARLPTTVHSSGWRLPSLLPGADTLTGTGQGLPVARYRVVEADQLQNLFVFNGNNFVYLLLKRQEAWLVSQLFKNRIVEDLWITQPKLKG